MSWWKNLAKIGLGVAAPFTGGASLAGIPILDAANAVVNGLSAGRQAGRAAETQATQNQDRNAIAAGALNLRAPQDRADQSLRGDYLANAKDFRFSHDFGGGSTGGFRPSMFSDATRKLGGQLSTDALRDQTTNRGRAVDLTPLPQSNMLDSILNTAGLFTNALSAYQKRPQEQQRPPWYGQDAGGG